MGELYVSGSYYKTRIMAKHQSWLYYENDMESSGPHPGFLECDEGVLFVFASTESVL